MSVVAFVVVVAVVACPEIFIRQTMKEKSMQSRHCNSVTCAELKLP